MEHLWPVGHVPFVSQCVKCLIPPECHCVLVSLEFKIGSRGTVYKIYKVVIRLKGGREVRETRAGGRSYAAHQDIRDFTIV